MEFYRRNAGCGSFSRWLGGRLEPFAGSSCREAGLHSFEHFLAGWKHAQESESPTIDEDLPVYQHFELSIIAAHHVHFSVEFTANPSRHPDGMESRDSVFAITN